MALPTHQPNSPQMNNKVRNSFFVALAYVGIGTIALLMFDANNAFILVVLLVTIPVTFIGGAIAYTEQESTVPIIIAQSLMFFLFWRVAFNVLKRNAARAPRRSWRLRKNSPDELT